MLKNHSSQQSLHIPTEEQSIYQIEESKYFLKEQFLEVNEAMEILKERQIFSGGNLPKRDWMNQEEVV